MPGVEQVVEQGFNPRPLLLTGESRRPTGTPINCACFNPRPLLLTGESSGWVTRCGFGPKFQSTPVIANGRILTGGPRAARHRSFNPRPLLLTGESGGSANVGVVGMVSIHARYC